MAGLVTYGSSDEEENLQDEDFQKAIDAKTSPPPTRINSNGCTGEKSSNVDRPSTPLHDPESLLVTPLVGPALGPTAEDIPGEMSGEDLSMEPQSPCSADRALLRDLTLPSVPTYDIPPSPLGPPMEHTNARFKHFLELKKQRIHFNEKLARSSALKNPSLMQKLLDFSSIDEGGQYATTLPPDLWNPNGFPEYAYKEELAKSQQRILKRKEEEKARSQREAVDFVPAATPCESLSRSGTPGNGRAGQKSTAERIMAGLDRIRSNSPQVQGTKRKTRFES